MTPAAEAAMTPAAPPPVIAVEDLCIRLARGPENPPLELVSHVSFSVAAGQILALVGESGCGKSLTCLALARLNPEPPFSYSGTLRLGAARIFDLSEAELRQVRGGTVAYIFQEPSSALNPVLMVGSQIAEAIRLHAADTPDVNARVMALLRQVGIPEPEQRAKAYPHQLSGGMQQRVMIAMALSCSPAVVVADEPTTALDVTIQAQILELLQRLCRDTGTAIVLVTHNLGIVAGIADTVGVMYAGQMVEYGPAKAILRQPAHPYTRALLAAVPRLGRHAATLQTIPGRVPPPSEYPAGCRFAGRCSEVLPVCASTPPRQGCAGAGHAAWCHRL